MKIVKRRVDGVIQSYNVQGWYLYAGRTNQYAMYMHREDKWNWGNLDIWLLKNGLFRIKLDEIRNGRRYKWKKDVKTFKEAMMLCKKLIRSHPWKVPGRN